MIMIPRSFVIAAALAAGLTFAAPAQAASIDTHFDICAALRKGASLASIETNLEARGYSANNAGAITGNTVQAARVMAQLKALPAWSGGPSPRHR